MIYPVKVYTPKGDLKETISKETLIVKHWKNIDIDVHVIKELKTRTSHTEEPLKPKAKATKPIITICAIWPILCGYRKCGSYTIKRSSAGKYCNSDCLRLEANRRRRKDQK